MVGRKRVPSECGDVKCGDSGSKRKRPLAK